MIIKPLTDRKWRGYTLDQLQDERIVNDAKIEIQKSILENRFEYFKQLGGGKGAFKKVFSAMNYMDYIVLAFTIIKKLSPIFRFFKKKK